MLSDVPRESCGAKLRASSVQAQNGYGGLHQHMMDALDARPGLPLNKVLPTAESAAMTSRAPLHSQLTALS